MKLILLNAFKQLKTHTESYSYANVYKSTYVSSTENESQLRHKCFMVVVEWERDVEEK